MIGAASERIPTIEMPRCVYEGLPAEERAQLVNVAWMLKHEFQFDDLLDAFNERLFVSADFVYAGNTPLRGSLKARAALVLATAELALQVDGLHDSERKELILRTLDVFERRVLPSPSAIDSDSGLEERRA